MATNIKSYAMSSSSVVTQVREKQSDDTYISYPIGTTGDHVLVNYEDSTMLLQTGINKIDERLKELESAENTSGNPVWTEIEVATYITIPIPTISSTYYYTGFEITPVWNNYNKDRMIMTGATSATKVGTYTVTFTPIGIYYWEDGTQSSISINWNIEQVTVTFGLDQNEVTISRSGPAIVGIGYSESLEDEDIDITMEYLDEEDEANNLVIMTVNDKWSVTLSTGYEGTMSTQLKINIESPNVSYVPTVLTFATSDQSVINSGNIITVYIEESYGWVDPEPEPV